MVCRLTAGQPDPALPCIGRRDLVRARGDLLVGGKFGTPVIGIAHRTADRAASESHKAHLHTAQMSFALERPEDRVLREGVSHARIISPPASFSRARRNAR